MHVKRPLKEPILPFTIKIPVALKKSVNNYSFVLTLLYLFCFGSLSGSFKFPVRALKSPIVKTVRLRPLYTSISS